MFDLVRIVKLRRGRELRSRVETVADEKVAYRLARELTQHLQARQPGTLDRVEVERKQPENRA